MVINKGDEVFARTERLCSNFPTNITVYQLEWMIGSFRRGTLERQSMSLSFDTGLAESRILFPIQVQPAHQFLPCKELHSLTSQMAKGYMLGG